MSEHNYEPGAYWSKRLEKDFSLRGTGHIAYSERYNRWLYRAKRAALQRALAEVEHPAEAFDIGSGTGWVIRQLLEFGDTVEGSDLTPVAVERLRQSFPDIEFHQLAIGADRIPHPDASLDLVTALDVLYHVADDESWAAGIHEIARVLRPGGCLVASDRIGDHDERPASHVRFRSLGRWEQEAGRAGMKLETVIPLYRWLSRDPSEGRLARLPDGLRGPIEYSLERLRLGRPHLRCAVLARLD